MRLCDYQYCGLVDYADALSLQEGLVARRKLNEVADTLLLLEHPHVITLGRSAKRENVIVADNNREGCGVELFETGRGGDVTYHGPGQLVGYPILNLAPDRCDVRRYVRDLEEVLIRTAAEFSIEATRIPGLTGVWVGDEKLAAIGVRISRWVTMHGFALNVATDLDYFGLIVPCGISDHGVTSIEKTLGKQVAIEDVTSHVVKHFADVFQRQMVARNGPILSSAGEPLRESESHLWLEESVSH